MPWLSIINAAIFSWLCAGIALRKRHGLHAAMRTLGFAFDLALLGYVEFSRKAIEQSRNLLLGVGLAILSFGIFLTWIIDRILSY